MFFYLQNLNGEPVSYLERAPFVRYSGAMGDYLDPCEIDNAFVDPLGLSSVKRRKRSAVAEAEPKEAGDYIFDANFTDVSYDDEMVTAVGAKFCSFDYFMYLNNRRSTTTPTTRSTTLRSPLHRRPGKKWGRRCLCLTGSRRRGGGRADLVGIILTIPKPNFKQNSFLHYTRPSPVHLPPEPGRRRIGRGDGGGLPLPRDPPLLPPWRCEVLLAL